MDKVRRSMVSKYQKEEAGDRELWRAKFLWDIYGKLHNNFILGFNGEKTIDEEKRKL